MSNDQAAGGSNQSGQKEEEAGKSGCYQYACVRGLREIYEAPKMQGTDRSEYPFNISWLKYDSEGKPETRTFKWKEKSQDHEESYRPFQIHRQCCGSCEEYVAAAVVNADTEEQLREEIRDTKKALKWYTVLCCFICALRGLKHAKDAEQQLEKGNDERKVRDTLLDAKIQRNYSAYCGQIFYYSCAQGALMIACLPFALIGLLIVLFCL